MHPKRFSNTYALYILGWRGINIDAMPGSMIEFKKIRPLDINLEIPVSIKSQTLPFYIMNEPALNTFLKELAIERDQEDAYNIEKVVDIKTQPLYSILDKYLPHDTHIDFFTIDAEGFDFEILQSNNWDKYKPDVILVENDLNFQDFINSDLYKFMQNLGYEFFAKTVLTIFLKRKNFVMPM
nr:FkbM family methyltransferase [Mucilaginibacter aurantiaciroseus]